MEFTSQLELYKKLIPVFNVKKRLSKTTKYCDIDNKIIWKYLVINKWKNSYNLQLSEMVNDIITLDLSEIYKFNEGERQR